MRIAFDLDDTLIPCAARFPTESSRNSWLVAICGAERLREGTCNLFHKLRLSGWEIWVYTSSHRRPLAVRLGFLAYVSLRQGVPNAPLA